MTKADVDAVAACLDDDLIYVHSTGVIDTKESYLAALTAGQFVYESIDVLETRHAQGADFVVLCHVLSARIRLKSQSESVQRQMVASSTWRLSDGTWRLISMQATPRASS
jgi:ketosteroid isomerase-like protein